MNLLYGKRKSTLVLPEHVHTHFPLAEQQGKLLVGSQSATLVPHDLSVFTGPHICPDGNTLYSLKSIRKAGKWCNEWTTISFFPIHHHSKYIPKSRKAFILLTEYSKKRFRDMIAKKSAEHTENEFRIFFPCVQFAIKKNLIKLTRVRSKGEFQVASNHPWKKQYSKNKWRHYVKLASH